MSVAFESIFHGTAWTSEKKGLPRRRNSLEEAYDTDEALQEYLGTYRPGGRHHRHRSRRDSATYLSDYPTCKKRLNATRRDRATRFASSSPTTGPRP